MYDLNSTIRNASKALSFDIQSHLEAIASFYAVQYPLFIRFLSGADDALPQQALSVLEGLKASTETLCVNYAVRYKSTPDTCYWLLYNQLQNYLFQLKTVNSLGKFMQSSRTLNNTYASGSSFSTVLQKKQKLENLAYKLIDSVDFDQDWIEIALDNRLEEEDYGNANLSVNIRSSPKAPTGYKFTSVADSINGENVYGKDANRKLTFENDDIAVLDYDQTANQTFDILLNLHLGDIPEMPWLGMQFQNVGTNINSLNLGGLARQLQEVFATDDSFVSVQLTNLSLEQGDISVEVTATTVLKDILIRNATLN